MWVYRKTESNLYTVGYYDQDGDWIAESDWPSKEKAAWRVHFLNGGN